MRYNERTKGKRMRGKKIQKRMKEMVGFGENSHKSNRCK